MAKIQKLKSSFVQIKYKNELSFIYGLGVVIMIVFYG